MSEQPVCARQQAADPVPGSRPRASAQTAARKRPNRQLPISPALRVQQARELGRRLDPFITGTLQVTITDNRSVMISVQRDLKRRVYKVRLHHLFADAPRQVLQTLAQYIMLADRKASNSLNEFIDERQDWIRDSKQPEERQQTIRTRGKVHDLQMLFDSLNARYFGGSVTCRISWGRHAGRGRARNSIKVGCFVVDLGLIRIHPGLDRN